MTAVSICRTKTQNPHTIQQARPGEIRLLTEVNAKSNRQGPIRGRSKSPLGQILGQLEVGQSVFLEGYTANHQDDDPRLRYMRTQSYTQRNTRVLTVRSTEEQGRKGVRVYREG